MGRTCFDRFGLRLLACASLGAALLGVTRDARAEGEAAAAEAPEAATKPHKPDDDGQRTLDLRAGWCAATWRARRRPASSLAW